MVERNSEKISDLLGLNLNELDSVGCIRLIGEILDMLTTPDLRRVRDLAEEKRHERVEASKNRVLAEVQSKLNEMGLDPEDVEISFGKKNPHQNTGKKIPPKYRSPDGKTWSGRGSVPAWIRTFEEQGGSRDEFLVEDNTDTIR
jgi:DNA-binding protein H-NS